MKKITDYCYSSSWQTEELSKLKITPGEKYLVLKDIGDLKKGELVKFVLFDDVDNHYGIFVFTDSADKILEVSGDFSGPLSIDGLKAALSKL